MKDQIQNSFIGHENNNAKINTILQLSNLALKYLFLSLFIDNIMYFYFFLYFAQ